MRLREVDPTRCVQCGFPWDIHPRNGIDIPDLGVDERGERIEVGERVCKRFVPEVP